MNENNELNNFGRMRCYHKSNSRLGVCGEKAKAEKKERLTTINQAQSKGKVKSIHHGAHGGHGEKRIMAKSKSKSQAKAINHGGHGENKTSSKEETFRQDEQDR